MDLSGRRLALISILAALVSLAAVIWTIEDIGITTDEPHYYESCLQEIAWVRQAWQDVASGDWVRPLSPEVIDRHWHFQVVYNVHPTFYKLCSSLTLVLFESRLGAMAAYRVSPAVMFSILVGLLCWTVGRRYGPAAGLWAAAALATMPRLFGDAHCGATDMPLTFLWFASAVTFHRALESRRWALAFAVVYGLALATKFTALVIPLPLVLYVIATRRFRQAAWPVGLSLVVSPLIMIGLNPEWWVDTFSRVSAYVVRSAGRSAYLHIPTYYLGRQYEFFLPWHHSLVYTLFTVQPLVLTGFIYGIYRVLRRPADDPWAGHLLLHWAVLHGVMILPSSPGHDGVRLFLPSFAFLAALSAKGFHHFVAESFPRKILPTLGTGVRKAALTAYTLLALMVGGSLYALGRIHPFELSYYNSLAGGVRGAFALGMETTYWWDAFNRESCEVINETMPPGSAVFARNPWHFNFLQRIGWLDPSLVFREEHTDYFILYHRQGLIGEQENVLIKWADPVRTFDLEGVRLFSIYKHPESVYDALRKISVAGKPELYYDVSLLNWTIGSLSSAIRNMQEYLILYPNDQKAVRFLLTMLIDNDQPLQALQVIEKYESQAGDKSGFDLLQAEACTRAGRDDEAIGLLNKVLAENRFETNALRMLGMIYYKKNNPDQAKKYFLRLLEINPNQKAGLQMLAWIHQKEGDIAAARRYYYGWLEMNPADVPILINTGGLELQSGRTAAADSLFRRVLKLDAGNLNACLNLANLFAGAGETDSAIVYLRLAAAAHPEQQEKIEKEYLPALLGKPVIPATGAANPAPAKP